MPIDGLLLMVTLLYELYGIRLDGSAQGRAYLTRCFPGLVPVFLKSRLAVRCRHIPMAINKQR